MRVSNLFRAAALGLFIGLAGACSNEELQNSMPDGQVKLNDGEVLTRMTLNGIGGTVATRAAGDGITTLAGEVKIAKLQIYSFVNLTAASPGVETDTPDEYTLERVYSYAEHGDANDLSLTPAGDKYQASFGVPTDTYKRIFVLIANDDAGRTPATAVAVANPVGDRSSATALSAIKAWTILQTALSATAANIDAPLPMTATAGRNEYDTNGASVFNQVYTSEDIKNGAALNAELKRQVARIDIQNPVATGFTVTKLTLNGAGNSLLFAADADIPEATTGGGAYDVIAFADKAIKVSAEMLPGALYAYPVKNSADGTPKVKVTGTMGGSGEISVEAKFDDNMLADNKGMMPNTRYVVNLHNSEGNITADITIAEWIPGETVDTEDVMTKLNATATLAVETGKSTLSTTPDMKVLSIGYYVSANAYSTGNPATDQGCNVDETFATVTGATSNTAPIGIILPDDCNWITVERDGGSADQAKYNLKLKAMNTTDRPRTAKLSLVTYDNAAKKQVVSEYTVHEDYVDMKRYVGEFDGLSTNSFSMPVLAADEYPGTTPADDLAYTDVYKLTPFASGGFVCYSTAPTEFADLSNSFYKVDILIPEDCSWIYKNEQTMGDMNFYVLGIADNIGKEERQVTIEMRRFDDGTSAIQTKKVTFIQTGALDKRLLSDGATITLNEEAKNKKLVKLDGNTIIIAGPDKIMAEGLTLDDVFFSIKGSPAISSYFMPVLVETNADWIMLDKGVFTPTMRSYTVNITGEGLFEAISNARETTLKVTTWVNGAPAIQTYRVIQKYGSGVAE